MSERKSRTDATLDRRSIAAVASSSVEGYLKNASRRVRVPTAEGGRGTRRKLAMVTSAVDSNVPQPEKAQEGPAAEPTDNAVDVDDEWDAVDLPTVPFSIKKQETELKAEATTAAQGVKDETVSAAPRPEELQSIKDENKAFSNLVGSSAPSPLAQDGDENRPQDALLPGTRPPLIEQSAAPRGAWRQRDPAYEAMMEQRDQLAAQRRSERIQRTSETVAWLLALLLRGRLLWRQAHHPKLVRQVLTVRRPAVSPPSTRRRRTERVNALGDQFAFYDAVLAAKKLVKEAQAPSARKLSLAPAWVTLSSDAVCNKTSEAVRVLLTALNEVFCLPAVDPPSDDAPNAEQDFTDWTVPLKPRALHDALRQYSCGSERVTQPDGTHSQQAVLPHPVYFSLVFLTLASACNLRCRLVIAKQLVKNHDTTEGDKDTGSANNEQEDDGEGNTRYKTKISIFSGMETTKKRGRAPKGKAQKDDTIETKSKKLPTSCFWVEVWSAERQSFLSVNPCGACATLWGAPYTFSVGPDVLVDATPRYTSKFSSCFSFGRRMGSVQQYSFLWRDKLNWDDNREVTDIILESFQNKPLSPLTEEQRRREQRQLESLRFSEPVPTTLTALRKHPLFVIESELARHEGVYPKDSTTIAGSVKGHLVYKRSAVAILRSRDGWLREGRSLLSEDIEPYKSVPPPASRPFAAPSRFYHISQTKPFEPLPLRDDDSLPLHGKTCWYVLLDAAPPPGLAHLTQPQMARVARRMQLSFGLAVTGFNRRKVEANRRGHWEAVIDGIVVREREKDSLCRAYEEWMQLTQEQEAARRRDRAFHWWLLFSQRLLTVHRLREQYMSGVARHGELPRL